jgi:uncharacterized protein (TIGR03437 family)
MMSRLFVFTSALGIAAFAQVSDNTSLTGKYYFRQVLLVTDGTANVTDTRTGLGTLTFDGKGNFTISGQQLVGTTAPASLSGSGTYTVKPGGFVTLSNPLRSGVMVNARLGTGALVGSSTEAGPTVFDLFLAIPAPATALSTATLNGPYWISTLEFPNGGVANVRNTNFKLTANGVGSFAESTVAGQAANLQNKLQNQTVGPITYTLAADGTGTITFPTAAGLDSTTQLIAGLKNVYVAQDGSYFIGGSATGGGHGVVVGVKAFANGATNASWNGFYFAAGMRYDVASQGFAARLSAVSGSVHAVGDGNSAWSRRTRQSDALLDVAPLINYALGADGSGPFPSTTGHVDLASTKNVFSTSGVDITDSLSYELYFGALMPPQSGPGLFLNPQGVFNSGSFAPPGYPVAPGTFVTLFGTGFGTQNATTTSFPVKTTLAGVQVTVNGTAAPIYSVVGTGSFPLITAIVPYGVTGSTATFQVILNGTTKSNTVDVPLAATAPGVFSVPPNGISDAAVRHADGTIVNSSSPATRGETVAVYLGGLGAVNPTVGDGQATPIDTLYRMTGPVNVYVGGQLVSNIPFAGLTPTLAGLYQLNIQIPVTIGSGAQSLAVQTNECFTDMVTIWVQ